VVCPEAGFFTDVPPPAAWPAQPATWFCQCGEDPDQSRARPEPGRARADRQPLHGQRPAAGSGLERLKTPAAFGSAAARSAAAGV
jgi:hypothetical protein